MKTVEYRVIEKYDQMIFQKRELRQRNLYQEYYEIASNRPKIVATRDEIFWGEWEDCSIGFTPPSEDIK